MMRVTIWNYIMVWVCSMFSGHSTASLISNPLQVGHTTPWADPQVKWEPGENIRYRHTLFYAMRAVMRMLLHQFDDEFCSGCLLGNWLSTES